MAIDAAVVSKGCSIDLKPDPVKSFFECWVR